MRVGSLAGSNAGSKAEPKTESKAESKAQVPVPVGAAVTIETPEVSADPLIEPVDPDPDLTLDPTEDGEPETALIRRAIPFVLGFAVTAVVAMFTFGLLDSDGQGETALQLTTPPTQATVPETAATAPTTTTATARYYRSISRAL